MTPEPMIECSQLYVTFRMPLALFVRVDACEGDPGSSWVTIREPYTVHTSYVRRVPFSRDRVLEAVERAHKELDAARPAATITAARFVDLAGGELYVRPGRVNAVARLDRGRCLVDVGGAESFSVDRPAADVVADLERALDAEPK